MKRYTYLILTVIMTAYLIVALIMTSHLAANEICTGVDIQINDTTARPFVSVRELNRDLDDIMGRAPGRPLSEINTDAIERRLASIDKIETAGAVTLTDGRLRIDVTPMRPVARIFDGDRSYYINKDGKRMSASARYHIDVPIIEGRLDRMGIAPESLLPLVHFIGNDPTWDALVTSIKIDSPHDIMLVPVIRGHIINIGDADNYPDKFRRLHSFYTNVLPHTGWSRYDTISVKWRGQVVATRARKGKGDLPVIEEDIDETDDATTMLPSDDALKEFDKEHHPASAGGPTPKP